MFFHAVKCRNVEQNQGRKYSKTRSKQSGFLYLETICFVVPETGIEPVRSY